MQPLNLTVGYNGWHFRFHQIDPKTPVNGTTRQHVRMRRSVDNGQTKQTFTVTVTMAKTKSSRKCYGVVTRLG